MNRRPDALTADLFQIPEPPAPIVGSLDYATELRCVLSEEIRKCGLTRHQIAARMSELTGQDITKSMLDAWVAESRSPWRFPFEYAAAFEVACQTTGLQELLSRKRGSRILVGEDVLLTELGRLDKQEVEIALRKRALKERLRGKL